MKRWKIYCGGLVLAASLASKAGAQGVPGAGGAAAAPGAAAATPAAGGAAAGGAGAKNIFSFICLTPEQKAACKDMYCNSALGQLLNNGLKPMSAMSGGIVGSCCPSVIAADLAKPADSAQGAAARIKADEADAKARREAVRYLGTVDCHYWPEAQDGLISALRADRNECVRLEATWSLGHGCCCTKATIKALTLTASGSAEDGNPSERSERVRASAQAALAHCLTCYCDNGSDCPEPEKKEADTIKKEGEKKKEGDPKAPEQLPPPMTRHNPEDYYRRVETLKRDQLIEDARRIVERRVPMAAQSAAQPLSGRSMSDIITYAMSSRSTTVTSPSSPAVVSEKPAAPAVVTEKPAVPVIPVSKPDVPSVSKTTPVTPPVPIIQPPAPAPVAPASHNVTPATRPSSPYGAPHATTSPEQTSSPQPQGAPVPVAYMSVLQGSSNKEQREWAAENLGEYDGWTNPRVVDALAKACRADQEATVRAMCLRSLARMNVQTLPVLTAVQAARNDSDSRVRAEAEQALRQLGSEGAGTVPPAPSAPPR